VENPVLLPLGGRYLACTKTALWSGLAFGDSGGFALKLHPCPKPNHRCRSSGGASGSVMLAQRWVLGEARRVVYLSVMLGMSCIIS